MPEIQSNSIRIYFTGDEVRHLVNLCWERIKSTSSPGELDWTTIRIFAKAAKAAKDYRLNISREEKQ
jgi:hypothetical protein